MQQTEHDRLRALLDAGIAVSAELSLDVVLQRIVEAAADLTGARYAALGVIDSTRQELEQFVVTGIDEETKAAIGELPRGRGILGVLIRDATPLMLEELSADPRSVGFPPHHPQMKTFLGVPILLRGVAFGNLYLTEKAAGSSFTDEDKEIVQLLAAQAAVAIENARLYESATRWLRQLESLSEVGNALSTEIELPRLLELVATRLRDLIQARLVFIATPHPDGHAVIRTAAGEDAEEYVGMTLGHERSKTARVLERMRSERVDSLIDDPEVDQAAARRMGTQTGLWVPLIRDRPIGVIVAHDKQQPDPRFSEEDIRIAEAFAERAAVAIDLSERVARDSLRQVVEGQELERKRLARELHDETGQALTSILLGLRPIEEAVGDRPDIRESVVSLRELVVATLHDVRRLAVELRPAALDDFGLVPALERLAETFTEQTGVKVQLEAALGERLPGETETALYRIVQEALTNVIKHAHARTVSIVLTRKGDGVVAVIEDDGRGFDPSATADAGLGLLGMRERMALLGGRVTVESSEGSGTTVAVEVPVR